MNENHRKWNRNGRVPTALYFTLLLTGVLISGALQAQTITPETKEGEVTPINKTSADRVSTNDAPKKDTLYPKFINPPGFYEGAILVSLSRGITISPSGSYLDHEKVYDENVRTNIAVGGYNNSSPYQPGVAFQSEYVPGDIGQVEVEYGAWENVGLGLTINQYSIDALRQDVYPGFSYFEPWYQPVPEQRQVYRGTMASGLLTFHPISRSLLDPYVALRLGIVGFTGEAHAGLTYDRFRYTNKVRGIGVGYGAAFGVNVFFGRTMGIKMEAGYNRQRLKADVFSGRTLSAFNAQVGFFINYSSLASKFSTL